MGYYIFSFGIDANKIKSAFSSKDEAIIEALKETESYENYKDNDLSFMEGISTQKALEDIIYGNKMDAKSGPSYGYALICMCEALGERLPFQEEIKLGTHSDLINQYLEEDFETDDIAIDEMLLMEDSNPFKIPYISDFPAIGFLDDSALKVIRKMLKNVDVLDEDIERLTQSKINKDEEKGFIYECIKGIIENIDHCLANNLGIISFCH
jgi:hypothetical protein